jgi:hypothetical protein
MIHEVEISPEIVKLAQTRTRTMGATLADELARNIAQEAIFSVDPELDLLVDESVAFSSEDALVAAFGVNDIVVNGVRVDVRPVDEEGRVSINRALLNAQYMAAGTLAVQMIDRLHGKVVGFVAAAEWKALDANAGDQAKVFTRARFDDAFDLGSTLAAIPAPGAAQRTVAPTPFELATFVANPSEINVKRQREVVQGVLSNPTMWPQLGTLVSKWSKGSVRRLLEDGAEWNRRLEKIADKLAPRFKRISREDVKKVVAKVGETMGAQPESGDFRKTLLSALTREELSHTLGGQALRKASEVADAVISGRAVTDAIKDFAKNPVAVELAMQIKRQRNRVADFVDASSQELSSAFQQMSLQPVYATHSQDSQAGVESVNEALKMLDAGELAEALMDIEHDLANI